MLLFNINYVIVYGLLAIAGFSFATSPGINKTDKLNNQLIILFSLLLFFLFGGRAFNVGDDTGMYIRAFQEERVSGNIGFSMFADIVRLFSGSGRFFLYAISFIFMLPICLFFCGVKYENKFLLFFMFVNMFSFVAMGINIVRQGIGVSLFLLAIYYLEKRRILTAVVLLFVSFSFHYSMIIPIGMYLVSRKLNTIIIPLICFIVAIPLSMIAFDFFGLLRSIPVLGGWFPLADGIGGIELHERYRTGFRLDFFIFNLFFAMLGLFYYNRIIKIFPQYRVYFSVYLFTSAFFFLMFHVPFSDRFGLFSWIFIPFLMFPFVQQENIFPKFGKIFSLMLISMIHILIT